MHIDLDRAGIETHAHQNERTPHRQESQCPLTVLESLEKLIAVGTRVAAKRSVRARPIQDNTEMTTIILVSMWSVRSFQVHSPGL